MRAVSGWLVASLALLQGCSGSGPLLTQPPRVPGKASYYYVASAVLRGPYLDARLERSDSQLRLLLPANDVCRRIVAPENAVTWRALGPYGELDEGDKTCTPVGIGALAQWRDRHPRSRGGPLPRARASFREVYHDDDVLMVRGRIPFAGKLGFAGGYDAIALLPQTATCRKLAEEGDAAIEFRVTGKQPLVLLSDRDRCPIEALATPLPPFAGPDTR